MRPEAGLLPSRSVGPEPAMISTTGGGVACCGNSRLPCSTPWPVSRSMGRCSTVGAAAWARLLHSRRKKATRRDIMRYYSGEMTV